MILCVISMFIYVCDCIGLCNIVIMKYMYLAMLYPINDLIWFDLKTLVILLVFLRVNSWFDGFCNKVPKYASNVSSHILFSGDYF